MTEKLTKFQNELVSEMLCKIVLYKIVLDGATQEKIKEVRRLLEEQMLKLNAISHLFP